MTRPRGGPSRLGSTFFAIGCLTVLGGTFAAGMYAGRSWPSFVTSIGPRSAPARTETARRPADARPPAPAMTFYEELAAPLSPAGVAAPPARTARTDGGSRPADVVPSTPAVAADPGGATSRSSAVRASATPPPAASASGASDRLAPRFTVQVGAFKARGPADALRARLTAGGHDAYVSETDAPGARYRVRVGAYSSRDEARQAAQRLSTERQVATYVTPR